MKFNSLSYTKRIKRDLFIGMLGLLGGFLFIGANIYILIVMFIFCFFGYLVKYIYIKDFIIIEGGFALIGIIKKIDFKNTDIQKIMINAPWNATEYKIFINKKKYYINISDGNKNSLIKYFQETNYEDKETIILVLNKKRFLD